MSSADLRPSATWQGFARNIAKSYRAGAPFDTIHEMNVAIKMGTLEPYRLHRARLDELLWHDDPGPKTIIDLGAGYGAMASFWPEGSVVYNVDLPEMLEIQLGYVASLRPLPALKRHYLVPINEADSIPFDGAYLFSAWALTETTQATWLYYIDKAPQLAGAYVLGFRHWQDEALPWPWEALAGAFKEVRLFEPTHSESMELAAVNR